MQTTDARRYCAMKIALALLHRFALARTSLLSIFSFHFQLLFCFSLLSSTPGRRLLLSRARLSDPPPPSLDLLSSFMLTRLGREENASGRSDTCDQGRPRPLSLPNETSLWPQPPFRRGQVTYPPSLSYVPLLSIHGPPAHDHYETVHTGTNCGGPGAPTGNGTSPIGCRR